MMSNSNTTLEKALTCFESYFKNPQVEKLSLARKRDLIDQISYEITILQRKQLMVYQPRIAGVVINLCQYGCGASLIRSMADLSKKLYTLGDFTKMQVEFFDQLILQISNPKLSAQLKISSCYISSKVFKVLWARCHTPQTKDLIDSFFKIAKGSQERFPKEQAYRALKDVIKANASNFFQISGDVFKQIQKAIQHEKINEAKYELVKCLRVFVQYTLNYSAMHQYFEIILQTAMKGFEETHPGILEEYLTICYCLFNLRLQESQQQGDFKTSFRIYNQQQRDAITGSNKKKQAQVYLDVPRSLSDIISCFSAIMLKISMASAQAAGGLAATQTGDNIRQALSQVFARIVESNRIHIEQIDMEAVLSPLLMTLSQKTSPAQLQDVDCMKQKEVATWIIAQILPLITLEQKAAFMKHCLQCLGQKQLILTKETLDNFSHFCKNQKMSTLMNDAHVIVLLKVLNQIIFESNSAFLTNNFTSQNEVIDPLMTIIKDQQSPQVTLYTIEVIKTIGFKAPQWLYELLSIFLSLTTITNANLTAMKQVPMLIYPDKSSLRPDAANLYSAFLNLNGLALAFSTLLQSVSQSIKGIPLALMHSTMNAAKGMVLGNWKVEEDEDAYLFSMDLQKIDLQDNQRREAGWIIIEGLVHLGNQWIGSRLSLFFKLLNSVFTKDMCVINAIQLKEPIYQEKILNEFRIKQKALSTLRCFLNKCFVLLNNQLVKLIASFLGNALIFFFNQDKEKKDAIQALFKQHFYKEMIQVKADMFECFNLIPSQLYQTKFVHLLHIVCEEIVSDDIQCGGQTPSLAKRQTHFEDQMITHSQSGRDTKKSGGVVFRYMAQKNAKNLKIKDAEEFSIYETNTQLLRLERSISCLSYNKYLNPKHNLLNQAILIFADIFTNSALNIKNKQSLIKHFILNTSPTTQQPAASTSKKAVQSPQQQAIDEQQRVKKIIAIALCSLVVVKQFAKKNEIIDQDIYNSFKLIFKNCELLKNELLIRIVSEGLVFLNVPMIMKDPSRQIDLFLKEQEVGFANAGVAGQNPIVNDEWVKKCRIAATLANFVRYLDYESFVVPFSERIITVFMKLSKESTNQIREFFLHYTYVIVKRIGSECPQFFQQIFPTAFHQMQTDIKTNNLILYSLGKIVEVQLRQNMALTNESRRAQIVLKEYLEILFLNSPKQGNKQIFIISLDIIKSLLILDPDQIQNKIQQIVTKLFEVLKQQCPLNIEIRLKIFELIGAMLYKGYYFYLQEQTKKDLIRILIDELNTAYVLTKDCFSEKRMLKKFVSKTKKLLTQNEEFEKLINFRQVHGLQNEKLFGASPDKSSYKTLVYRYEIQVLLTFVLKIGANNNIQEWIDVAKNIINYKHSNVFQKFEEQKKAQMEKQSDAMIEDNKSSVSQFSLQFDLREETREFIIRAFKNFIQLFSSVDTHNKSDIRKYLSTLIGIAFTIISNDSEALKKVGFSLIIVLVKLFSRTIEKIGDDDDDEQNSHQIFMNNPLLLEQYEAQIYSIIRQNLGTATGQSSGQSAVKPASPEIVIKNYKLIYHFLTIPICKDPMIIGRIVTQLIESLNPNLQLQSQSDAYYYEKLMTDTHFKKLTLLSKLMIACYQDGGEKFKKIETNVKRINDSIAEDALLQKSKKEKFLLSKFGAEDKQRIMEAFTPQMGQLITTHLLAALQDDLLILTMPKSSIKGIKDFTFIKSGTRSAYNQVTIEKSVQVFMKALTLLPHLVEKGGKSDVLNFNPQQSQVISGLILYYLVKPIDLIKESALEDKQQVKGPNNDTQNDATPHLLYNYVTMKSLYLTILLTFIESKKIVFKQQQELDEYCQALTFLTNLGINEINENVLLIYQQLLNQNFHGLLQNETKLQYIREFSANSFKILAEVQPEFMGIKQENAITKQEIQLIRISFETLNALLNYQLNALKNGDDNNNNSMNLLKQTISLVVFKVAFDLNTIGNESLVKYYATQVISLIGILTKYQESQKEDQLEILYKEFIQTLAQKINDKENNTSAAKSQYQILILCQALPLISNNDYYVQVSESVTDIIKTDNNGVVLTLIRALTQQFTKQQKTSQAIIYQSLAKQLIVTLFQLIFDLLQKQESEAEPEVQQLIQETANFLVYLYQSQIDEKQRLDLVDSYMVMIFTLIQSKKLGGPTRNSLVELILKLFQIDGQAFKNFVQINATTQERALTEKIVKELSARIAQQQKQGANQPANVGQGLKASAVASSQDEGGAGKPAGKIKLTMNFGKK